MLQPKVYKHYIGKPINQDFYGSNAYFISRYYGNILSIAMQGYGKSALIKHIITLIANYEERRCLIFDVMGEWRGALYEPNPHSKAPLYIKKEDIQTLNNVTIKLSDMKSPSDWFYLTFPLKASQLLDWINKEGYEYHEDSPDKFFHLIEYLPCSQKQIEEWNTNFPKLHIFRAMDSHSVTSMQNFMMFKDLFYNPLNPNENRTYVKDWNKTMREKLVTIVDLNLASPRYFAWAGLVLGVIMERLVPYLKYLKPIIVIEEADNLCGNIHENKGEFKSGELAVMYAKKLRKKGATCIYISQTFSSLNPELVKVATQIILGQIDKADRVDYYKLSSKLRFNLDKNYREFYLIDRINNMKMRFIPCETCCMCETALK
jgi:hypothetical protein